MAKEFQEQLIEFLPKMRIWALALTRNRAAAEDLAQDVATKALVARDCFTPGTNFSAWVHRIMINHFISGVRNKREFTDMDTIPEVAVQAPHEDRTALRELGWEPRRTPADSVAAYAEWLKGMDDLDGVLAEANARMRALGVVRRTQT